MLEYEFVVRNVTRCPVDRRAEGIRDRVVPSPRDDWILRRHYPSKLSSTPNKPLTPLSRAVQLHKVPMSLFVL